MASVSPSLPLPSGAFSDADAAALHRLEEIMGRTMAPHVLQARAMFLRELPRLLREWPNYWIAYRGEQEIAIGKDKTAVYQECLGSGLHHGEFVVFCIEPPLPREVSVPVDV